MIGKLLEKNKKDENSWEKVNSDLIKLSSQISSLNILNLKLAVECSRLGFIKHISDSKKVPAPTDQENIGGIWLEVRDQEVGVILKEHGFDINHSNKDGNTPLDRLIMGVITTTSNEEISKLKSQLEILTSLGATTTALFWQNVVQNGNGHT